MSDNNYQEVIKNNKLFDGIPPQNLKFSFRNEQIIRRKEGEIIFQKGDKSFNTFLIIAGRVKIKVYIENKSVKLNKSINDFFGEIEVLEDTYRRSAAVANTDCILYALSKGDLRAFLEANPEINDNIIAYNKVEIPELQITINPGLLKDDTDKLYLTPQPENNAVGKLALTENDQAGNEYETKRREIEKTAEMILEINGDEEEYDEEDLTEDEPDESVESVITADDDLTDESTAVENFPSDEEAVEKRYSEFEDQSIPEPDVDIERPEEPGTEAVMKENNPGDAEENSENKDLPDEGTDLQEDDLEIRDPDFEEEITLIDEIPDETGDELSSEVQSVSSEDISFEDDAYLENDQKLEKVITQTDNIENDSPDRSFDPADESAGENQEENLETNKPQNEVSESNSDASGVDREKTNEWINLNPVDANIEFHDELSEEEKVRYETEEEKLKYDDTEISAGRILNAIRKINSSFDKKSIYANIVRESVKLTEAQAGILYRVDPVKNQLVTEIENEDGMVEAAYTLSGGLTGLAAETGEIINVREPVKDFRYSEDVDSIRGIVGSSIMCVPVKNENNDTIAVISLANSSSGKFSISDEEKISVLAAHISQALHCIDGIDKMLDENKNIYLSTLTNFITDNIRTPVLTMKYYASQMKRKDLPPDIKTVLSVLMDQADSVVDFLHSTLAFTENSNRINIETTSLQEVMDGTLGLLAEYVESRNVGLYKKVENDIKVKLDKKAFYQACHQIAKNACDAMGESGNIYITAKQSGDLVNIEFRDTGPGIPEEHRTQIFEPFKSFKQEKGTGLGLTIAQKIIRDHGGELTVESSPEKGATFIISLPVFDEI